MSDALNWNLLRSVSRSFYFSLRLLPSPVRESVALAYLLARLSDTIADESDWPVKLRLQILKKFPDARQDELKFSEMPALAREQDTHLLLCAEELLETLRKHKDADLIKAVWKIILQGQIFDTEYFVESRGSEKVLSDEELERYIYEVAGCVGSFWTQISERHLPGWRRESFQKMEAWGVAYGKGLQLVNILRDARRDRQQGRFYFLEKNREQLLQRCRNYLEEGRKYAKNVRSRRLRIASSLPLDIAFPTLRLVENATAVPQKISRSQALLRIGWRIVKG